VGEEGLGAVAVHTALDDAMFPRTCPNHVVVESVDFEWDVDNFV
jgi:hypothetical protein